MSQWYAKTNRQTLDELDAGRSGLSPRQAQERLEKYGPNKLAGAPKKPLWARFLDQMRDPMILVLLAAARLPRPRSSGAESRSGWRPTPWCPATSLCWRRGTWCPPTPGFWSAPT